MTTPQEKQNPSTTGTPTAVGAGVNAYVVARLGFPEAPHEDLCVYMEQLLPTMRPFGGHILSHGKQLEALEGDWPGYVVILGFPDVPAAHAWYDSPDYQQLIPKRRRHVTGELMVVEGNPPGYDATAAAARMRSRIPTPS